MNRLHLATAIAAFALIAAPTAFAATSDSGSSSVTADVANTLQATFPSDYAWGTLNAGTSGNTSAEQTVTVYSNATWGVKVSSDLANGKMKEWTGIAYVPVLPKVLTNALNWKFSSLAGVAQGSSFNPIDSTATLVAGSQAVTSDSGVAVGVTYKQVISYADVAAGVNDYRILATYQASQGF